jgi:HD-GYP domain-containing protein (c-di-GMP phosphodiesterase class II)
MKKSCYGRAPETSLAEKHFKPALVNNSILLELNSIKEFIAGIIDDRYPDLGEHQTRVTENSALFARYIDLSQQDNEFLVIGAGIHDVGKISISDYILNKPAKLTRHEFALVKQHAELGYKLLAPLKLNTQITEIVLYHHENYDGSGYPEGLSGENIPFLARMARILDTYDALTMDRPYHKGISGEEAITVMQQDLHFYDPTLLNSFSEMIVQSNFDLSN